MRFKSKPEASNGDTRIITKFCWFPIWVKGRVIWLERVTLLQRYDDNYGNYDDWEEDKWTNVEILPLKKKK